MVIGVLVFADSVRQQWHCYSGVSPADAACVRNSSARAAVQCAQAHCMSTGWTRRLPCRGWVDYLPHPLPPTCERCSHPTKPVYKLLMNLFRHFWNSLRYTVNIYFQLFSRMRCWKLSDSIIGSPLSKVYLNKWIEMRDMLAIVGCSISR